MARGAPINFCPLRTYAFSARKERVGGERQSYFYRTRGFEQEKRRTKSSFQEKVTERRLRVNNINTLIILELYFISAYKTQPFAWRASSSSHFVFNPLPFRSHPPATTDDWYTDIHLSRHHSPRGRRPRRRQSNINAPYFLYVAMNAA